MEIRTRAYDDPDVMVMTLAVLDEYKVLYSSDEGDVAHVEVDDFAPLRGWFGVGYEGEDPMAMGGWRRLPAEALDCAGGLVPGRQPAEIKRMYVAPGHRGGGRSRAMLTEIERTARAAGVDYLILETGPQQPAAIGLYRSAGYSPGPRYGAYADHPEAVHLAKWLA